MSLDWPVKSKYYISTGIMKCGKRYTICKTGAGDNIQYTAWLDNEILESRLKTADAAKGVCDLHYIGDKKNDKK